MKLRPYQEDAVRHTFDYINKGGRAGILALITAAGKSVIIAEILKRILLKKPHVKMMMLTHVKELIEQNEKRLKSVWPAAPVGIYSSGIGKKQLGFPITYAGIQSVYRHAKRFGKINLLLIDECHLVSAEDESMYLSFINALKEANPDLVVLGLTATPYRLGMGYLTEGPIFKDIFYDNTKMDAFVQMIDDGYVSDLISVDMDNKFDLSAVKVTKGDFQEKSLDENINRDEITKAIIEESLPHIAKRKKGLVFCVSMSHAENMSMRFNEVGVKSTFVHSELSKEEREKRLKDFDKGLYKVICNVGVLTTGFDQPDIDFLIIARPSQSTSLHVQMLGRGMRIAPEKLNTLVLDFAGNTMRLGPVNDPVIPQPKGKGVGEAPVKICETCSTINHASVRVCKVCGSPFPEPEVKITPKLETVDVIRRKDIPIINDEDVQAVLFNMYTTVEGLKKVKVTVVIGMSKYIDLFLTFDPSLGRQYKDTMELIKKLKFSTKTPTLENADDALEFMKTYLIKPQKVKVWHNKPVPGKNKRRKQILSYLYEDK
jgi:DNA repair protein RadD